MFKKFFMALFATVLMAISLGVVVLVWPHESPPELVPDHKKPLKLPKASPIKILSDDPVSLPSQESCTFHTCLDVYHCGYNDDTRISVYVYPLQEFVDENGATLLPSMSKEFYEIIEAVMESPFYTSDPTTACLFVPLIDVLNQNKVRLKETSRALAALQRWVEPYEQCHEKTCLRSFRPGLTRTGL